MLLCKETMVALQREIFVSEGKIESFYPGHAQKILALWQFLIGEEKWKSAVGWGTFDNKIVPPMDLALEASLENPSNRAVQRDTAPKGCALSPCISPSKRFSVFPPLHARHFC